MEWLLYARHFADFIDWQLASLEKAKRTDPSAYATQPKGTPFYFLGIAAFASHDYQSATFFFDAAAWDDLKDRPLPTEPDRPALLFMCLRDDKEEQAARPFVQLIAEKLRAAVANYNRRDGGRRGITEDDVRKAFLERLTLTSADGHRRTLAATFISFLAEWDYRSRMIDLCETGSREPFFTHLFRGCLLFESLLKESNEPAPEAKRATLGTYLKHDRFKRRLYIGKIETGCDDFDVLVQSLAENEPVEKAIQCTAQARNTLGHNLVWATQSLDRRSYDLMASSIASSCLHAIACLYMEAEGD